MSTPETDVQKRLAQRRELILNLYKKHEADDKTVFDNILTLYQGKFWDKNGPLSLPGRFTESDLVKSSINLVFAITESSRSVLIPTNPQVTLRDGANDADRRALLQEKAVNQALRNANLAEELGMWVDDVVLFGRGIFKVVPRSIIDRRARWMLHAASRSRMRWTSSEPDAGVPPSVGCGWFGPASRAL